MGNRNRLSFIAFMSTNCNVDVCKCIQKKLHSGKALGRATCTTGFNAQCYFAHIDRHNKVFALVNSLYRQGMWFVISYSFFSLSL